MRLEGKVALVTGAGRNIGRAIATLFAAEGADLIVGTASDADSLAETAGVCRAAGATVLEVLGDVASPFATAAMVSQGTRPFRSHRCAGQSRRHSPRRALR